MDLGVVAGADEGQVLDVGSAAVAPVDDVVCFAVVRWRCAARYDAAAVAGDQGAALGGGDGADVAAQIQDGAAGGEEGLLQGGIAAQLSQQAVVDQPAEPELGLRGSI